MPPPPSTTMRLFQTCFAFLLVLSTGIFAQSFEGKMTGTIKNRHLDLYIWVDVVVPKDTGAAQGTYFYKTVGKEIRLAGKRSGAMLQLTEFDKKKQPTGTFKLQFDNDTLQGMFTLSGRRGASVPYVLNGSLPVATTVWGSAGVYLIATKYRQGTYHLK